MKTDVMLKCLIAFVLGFMVARMNGVVEGSEKKPTAPPGPWGKLGMIVGGAASKVASCGLPKGGLATGFGQFSYDHNSALNRQPGTWYDYHQCGYITEVEYTKLYGTTPWDD